ncbi:hypothetical protein PILCRDRAFT_9000 [Piloderma croceum F 1598]|uniref:Uncharacterized protein n=1 Tax=Piloderma croceum (strain F 1598) TaxID=765440 RepID=A0A0C3F8A0_PILCF|nr:hypothetical protein PILCRDRAFT_9000 [Piloderma croceum F 1598]
MKFPVVSVIFVKEAISCLLASVQVLTVSVTRLSITISAAGPPLELLDVSLSSSSEVILSLFQSKKAIAICHAVTYLVLITIVCWHVCDMGKHKKKHVSGSRKFKELQGHVDGLAEEVLEIERANTSKKRKRDYANSNEDGSITKPPGTAGKGGGLGYNLQSAMGLSGRENEQIYLSLLQKVRKAVPRHGIDITKTITCNRQIVVIKFITLCQKKWPFFHRFEDGDEPANWLTGDFCILSRSL